MKTASIGFLAENESEWFAALAALVDNKSLRAAVGTAARADVCENYTASVNAADMIAAIQSVRAKLRTAATARPGRGEGKLRLLYVSGESNTPGHTYRVAQYIAAAEASGIEAQWIAHSGLPARFGELRSYDILVVWRAPWDENIERAISLMKDSGRLVIFDCDDLMTEPDLAVTKIIDGIRTQNLTEEMVRGHYSRMRQTMLAADICFATTEELAFYMRCATKATHVLPNGFSQATHDLSRSSARDWLVKGTALFASAMPAVRERTSAT